MLKCTGVTEPEENLPRLRVPERYHAGFARIIRLGDESFQKLLNVLRDTPPALDYTELSSVITPKVSAVPPGDVGDILETLEALYSVRARLALPVADFAEAVRKAVEEGGAEELSLPGENGERLKERLTQLLDIDALDVTRKALDVLHEHEHTLHDARIMTDIRPVFGLDTDDDPTGALIVHMLKVSYHDESEEVKEFYIALDAGDIDMLIDLLRRADSKAKSLQRVIERAKVPYIDAG